MLVSARCGHLFFFEKLFLGRSLLLSKINSSYVFCNVHAIFLFGATFVFLREKSFPVGCPKNRVCANVVCRFFSGEVVRMLLVGVCVCWGLGRWVGVGWVLPFVSFPGASR